MPRPRIDFSLGNSGSGILRPNSSIESRWISARIRTFDPHPQVAGSVAKCSTSFQALQTLQPNATIARNYWFPPAVAGRFGTATSRIVTVTGIAIGLAGSIGVTRLFKSQLVGVKAFLEKNGIDTSYLDLGNPAAAPGASTTATPGAAPTHNLPSAGAIASSVGGNMETVRNVAIPILWCFTIPWSIVGARWRNRTIDRQNASILGNKG